MSEEKIIEKEAVKDIKKEPIKEKTPTKSATKLAAIRVRGKINLTHGIIKTFENLNLYKQNWCIVLDNTPVNAGMLRKLKDYITFGEIDDAAVDMLNEKKGEEYTARLSDSKNKINHKKYREYKGKKYKKYFRLNPPKGGFERKGIKNTFISGGVLGNRKEKIIELIQKMI